MLNTPWLLVLVGILLFVLTVGALHVIGVICLVVGVVLLLAWSLPGYRRGGYRRGARP